ncbi:MAG: TonB-dependent receptor, partial [Bacteroidota bacterium]
MKRLIFLATVMIYTLGATAQMPGGQPANGKSAMDESNQGHIYGKVADSLGNALSNASVLILQKRYDSVSKKSKDVLLKAVTTKSNGEFNFEDLPVRARLNLKISSVGYTTFEQAVSFIPPAGGSGSAPAPGGPGAFQAMSFDKDLGVIKLNTSVGEIQNVIVTSSKSLMKLDIDKKVFNVDKNIVSDGGTAVDVMKNVPSLQVDIDGNVTLRNSSPQIFVDGLPTTLTLEQIPANAIESVEVITNPSAKYDASGGGAGILNIVLKKNKKVGYNGNVRAGINKYGAVDGGLDFSLRQNKFNLSAGVNVRQANNQGSGSITRTNITDVPVTTINQVNTDNNKGTMIFGRLGFDYYITNKTTLSLTGMRMRGEMSPNSLLEINTDSLYNSGTVNSYSQRNTASSRIFNGQGLTFGLKHIYKEGDELTANLNYFTGKADNSTIYSTDYYNKGKGSDILNTQTQKILGGGTDKNIILQADYTKKISSTAKLEGGVRAAIRSRINLNDNYV